MIMDWPTEIVAKAEFEIRIFESPSIDTSRALLEEVKKLRATLRQLAEATDNLAVSPTSVNREDAQAIAEAARKLL
jgi:hypothetical protein